MIAYYSGPPKSRKRRALFMTDGQPFTKCMKAIMSNSEAIDVPGGRQEEVEEVLLLLERDIET